MKLNPVHRYDCSYISICFGFVWATFQGKDGDIEDKDADKGAKLSKTEEQEQKPKEPKKDMSSKNSRSLLKI